LEKTLSPITRPIFNWLQQPGRMFGPPKNGIVHGPTFVPTAGLKPPLLVPDQLKGLVAVYTYRINSPTRPAITDYLSPTPPPDTPTVRQSPAQGRILADQHIQENKPWPWTQELDAFEDGFTR